MEASRKALEPCTGDCFPTPYITVSGANTGSNWGRGQATGAPSSGPTVCSFTHKHLRRKGTGNCSINSTAARGRTAGSSSGRSGSRLDREPHTSKPISIRNQDGTHVPSNCFSILLFIFRLHADTLVPLQSHTIHTLKLLLFCLSWASE